MKALLIADADSTVRTFANYLKTWGFDTIRYRSAVKAIDNIEEIAPDAVLISTGDFPRHWKTIVQFIRSDTDKERTVIILLINDRFTAEDADKAVHIGVQAIVSETMTASNDEKQLLELFSRYRNVGATSSSGGAEPDLQRALFLFTNPFNGTIVTGRIERLGPSEIQFKPDAPSAASDLADGDRLDQCTLKIDRKILPVSCIVRKNTNLMILELVDLPDNTREEIHLFISSAV
jgi:hypothetical protein